MKKKLIIYIGIIIGFLVLAYGFVPQVLGGKIINQSDISGYRGMAEEMTLSRMDRSVRTVTFTVS